MMMTQQLNDLLLSMSNILGSLLQQPGASFEYQGVCDGLVWSDEIPSVTLTDQQEQLLRYLIQYRTSLIVAEPILALESLWDQAGVAFPGWAGFAKERCKPTTELSEHVSAARRHLETSLEQDS
jgi:hypothetical protein